MKNKFYKRELVLGIVLLFIGAGAASSIVSGETIRSSPLSLMIRNTWYVSKYGNDSNNGTSWSSAWLTISHAIRNSSVLNGDNITVGDGNYNESVVIDKRLNIIGNGSSITTINGNFTGNVIEIGEITSGVNISGFNIIHSGYNKINAGIYIESSNNNITGNNISYNGYAGIYILGHNNRIVWNKITTNYGEGIKIFGDNSIIRNNTISNNGIGVIAPAGNGIRIMEETYNTYIIDNTISNNNNDGIHALTCYGLSIINNKISNQNGNDSGGIALFLVGNINCTNNMIFNNTHGIYFFGTLNVLCEKNNIKDNTKGITAMLLVPPPTGGSGNHTIRYNTIDHNEINIWMVSSIFIGFGVITKGNNNVLRENNIVNAKKWALKAELSFAQIPLNYWGGILAGCPYLTTRNHINRFRLSLVIVNPCWPEEI